jgi:two-component system sensor histidine kinase TctE
VTRPPRSLRRTLLAGILLPVGLLVVLNTVSLYHQALAAVTQAYDRTLLASARTIGEQLDVEGYDSAARIRATVPYSALETFEADNQSRLFYRVSQQDGTLVSGFDELPFWRGTIPQRPPYAALVDFYDDTFRGGEVRVAVLLQPVASGRGLGMAVVQVAETPQLRRTLARQVLWDTLWRQALLIAVIAGVVVLVVNRATRPVRRLRDDLLARPEGDVTPLAAPETPRELQPVLDAVNESLAHVRSLVQHQQRFVRDAAHQLRTPLAVLKVQVQAARREGDAAAALAGIEATVDRATTLANQMLTLAKIEQLRQEAGHDPADLVAAVRDVALDLSPLVAERDLDFSLDTQPAHVPAHAWMLRELVRNLLHNAIRHSPPGARLALEVERDGPQVELRVRDCGSGLAPEIAARLFQPFASTSGGAGLGLAICQEIVGSIGGTLVLRPRPGSGVLPAGLDAIARLPAVPTSTP